MFVCKLCEAEMCLTTYICGDCRKIRHLMNLYSKQTVLAVLDKCLVISKFKPTDDEPGDETHE